MPSSGEGEAADDRFGGQLLGDLLGLVADQLQGDGAQRARLGWGQAIDQPMQVGVLRDCGHVSSLRAIFGGAQDRVSPGQNEPKTEWR
jgi:hypothetical protein